jgi:hypothetical protein
MKQKLILFCSLLLGLSLTGFTQSQPNNIDIGLFANGTNGSNSASGAQVEVALRAHNPYTPVPVATDFVLYIKIPSAELTGTEVSEVVEANANLFGASGTMIAQDTYPADAPNGLQINSNTYFFFVFNQSGGINLSSLPANQWKFAFTFKFTPALSTTAIQQMGIIDRTNYQEITDANGSGDPIFTILLTPNGSGGGDNQLTASAANSVLPVRLGSFNVSDQNGSDALASWTSLQEQNVSHYVLERSSAQNAGWSTAGQVKAKGNTSSATHYSFLDENVYKGSGNNIFFYRLKTVDLDGKYSYSDIRTVRFNANAKGISLYPNPVRDGFTLSIAEANTAANLKYRLNLVNRLGQVVSAREINSNMARNYYYDVKTSGITNGEYMLQIILDGQILDTKKIIIQR